MHKNQLKNTLTLLPTFGILIFVALYLWAAALYPGGSQADLNTIGFDWVNNYWCNLMNEKGMNKMVNPARPIAISAMVILCASLLLFFFQFARHFVQSTIWQKIIRLFGTFSMLTAVLIFTAYHDLMTILSSVFGLFVVIGIIWTVYKSKMTFFKLTGIFCILLLILNNFVYYTQIYLAFLPLLQKITFAIVLLWIIGLNWNMIKYRK